MDNPSFVGDEEAPPLPPDVANNNDGDPPARADFPIGMKENKLKWKFPVRGKVNWFYSLKQITVLHGYALFRQANKTQ